MTKKNDVYSFGVVLLELLSGRRAVVSDDFDLVQWALDVIDRPAPRAHRVAGPGCQGTRRALESGRQHALMLRTYAALPSLINRTSPDNSTQLKDVGDDPVREPNRTYGFL